MLLIGEFYTLFLKENKYRSGLIGLIGYNQAPNNLWNSAISRGPLQTVDVDIGYSKSLGSVKHRIWGPQTPGNI